MLVLVQTLTRLGDQQVLVRLQLEGDNKGVRHPEADEGRQHLRDELQGDGWGTVAGLHFVHRHLVAGNVKVGDGSGQVEHCATPKGGQAFAGGAQQPHVVDDAGEAHVEDAATVHRLFVLGEDGRENVDRVGFHWKCR